MNCRFFTAGLGSNAVKRGCAVVFAFVLGGVAAMGASVPGVAFDQRIGQSLPSELTWQDTEGTVAPMSHWWKGRAMVLWFGYAKCPQLCAVVADGMVSSLRELQPSVGRDYDVFMISIDPKESRADANAARSESLGRYGRTGAGAGWTYLTGDEAVIKQTADAAGFRFTYDPRSQQFAHASGCLVLTPEGKISAYFPGLDFAPKELAAAIAQANRHGLGQKVTDLLLVCFHGDGISGRYGKVIWRVLGLAVFVTIVALTGWIGRMLWLERHAHQLEQKGRA